MDKITSPQEMMEDWRVKLMVEVNKLIQEVPQTFIPIV